MELAALLAQNSHLIRIAESLPSTARIHTRFSSIFPQNMPRRARGRFIYVQCDLSDLTYKRLVQIVRANLGIKVNSLTADIFSRKRSTWVLFSTANEVPLRQCNGDCGCLVPGTKLHKKVISHGDLRGHGGTRLYRR